ncbi:DNA polymerase III subunit delta [Bacillus sp. AFS076308]|uniref:DNA polymerase III subunit delta n=1 Tax=unclassified Bacillus (in: firmicutes) TaxID=185979 RepID=UPI000BF25DE4|nr:MULTISPECIES: DNA polymerase III subunit delta [unclassified Bacillus (in: firmicutes)]PFO03651.1 DNA polymerase III subunit delta [Bacillus sp. AFS076308]PGV54382.1 DNA polymerase III subunit delta [Bacillus sp. AFS037270]
MVLEIWRKIKKKEIAPIYLLYGTEAFLINETKQLLLNQILDEEDKDFNFSAYDLEETPVDFALEDAETFPFLGEKKVVFLHNPVFLTAEKTKEKVEHNLAKLEAYLKEPAPYTVMVISAPYEKLDERKKITKELKRNAELVEAKKLSEHELKKWVKERAKSNGLEFEEKAIDQLLSLAGTNMFMLSSEVDKLSLYAAEQKRIDSELVEKLVARTLEQNIFTLIERVVQRRLDEALRIYYDLLKQNEEPIKILALLSGQFRLIYQVKELSRRGYGQQQIAGYLKIHPFRVKLALGQAGSFTDEELANLMEMLAEADYQMKTGGMNKSLLIEMLLFRLKR